jgi:hypothetical protein
MPTHTGAGTNLIAAWVLHSYEARSVDGSKLRHR